ncbi:hypothetical protein [Ramlibacter sp. WS9]|uniref:hypothetical protein n=1 Tax=Ramlibacter sp. WS9 TaxID=1882741 RepID=UPI0011436FA5|nr:hypothetical protein [Ramlibacter sp. WS9]ROZ61451.1 hypothetical protein EEB15_32710 [Ramlibacter sp. WS9]
MFDSFLKHEKPRVFLGTLAVVPRKDMKRHVDQWGMFRNESFDDPLRTTLEGIFSLPPASEVSAPHRTDLGLDVLVLSFQSGDYWDLSLEDMGLPVFWRPKITVACRLYHLKSQKTKRTFSATQKMPWGEFVSRQLTLQAIFRFRPTFDQEDMKCLLYGACHSLLNKLRKVA